MSTILNRNLGLTVKPHVKPGLKYALYLLMGILILIFCLLYEIRRVIPYLHNSLFELTCACACWALIGRFPSVCHLTKSHWTIIYILTTKGARVTIFGVGLCLDDIWVDLKGQGHRSRSSGQKCLKVNGQ